MRSFLADVSYNRNSFQQQGGTRNEFSVPFFRNVHDTDRTLLPLAEDAVLTVSPVVTAYVVYGINDDFLQIAAPARAHNMNYFKK